MLTDVEGREIYTPKIRVEGLYPTLAEFEDTIIICLLTFLATLHEELDDVVVLEATEFRTMK